MLRTQIEYVGNNKRWTWEGELPLLRPGLLLSLPYCPATRVVDVRLQIAEDNVWQYVTTGLVNIHA
jgi:hypothetical protein